MKIITITKPIIKNGKFSNLSLTKVLLKSSPAVGTPDVSIRKKNS